MTACLPTGAVLFGYFSEPAQTVTIDVDFKLTALESDKGIPSVPVRLVLGAARDWQDPNAGNRFVTDANGQAHFVASGVIDQRWRTVPYAMTGLSLPKRADHIMVAAELEQLVPQTTGKNDRVQWLHTLDIDCYTPSDCASSDITAVYTRDVAGRFTIRGKSLSTRLGPPAGLQMPELGGMALTGPGYKAADFFLSTSDPTRKRWTLRLGLQRLPAPIMR